MPNAVGQKLNHGMPSRYEDKLAYDRERKRRIKNGTWIRRGMKHGFGKMSQHCECRDCKIYQRGYRAGHQTAMNRGMRRYLYQDDPVMSELLP